MMEIRKGDDHDLAEDAGLDLEEVAGGHEETQAEFEQEQSMLRRALKISVGTTIFMTLALLVLWPMPMYGSGYIFSKPFFTGWVAVGILWIFCSFIAVGLFPVYEGRATLFRTFKYMFTGTVPSKHTITHGEPAVVEKETGTTTPGDKEVKESTTVA